MTSYYTRSLTNYFFVRDEQHFKDWMDDIEATIEVQRRNDGAFRLLTDDEWPLLGDGEEFDHALVKHHVRDGDVLIVQKASFQAYQAVGGLAWAIRATGGQVDEFGLDTYCIGIKAKERWPDAKIEL